MNDFEDVLMQCDDRKIAIAVNESIRNLFERDLKLLKLDASERSISGRLAKYLEPHFKNYSVDIEYNRMGDIPKEVVWNKELDLVYPDVIVHIRETDDNVLVIEIKKDSNPESKEKDILKLKAYKRTFQYREALFLRFEVKETAGTISECEWV